MKFPRLTGEPPPLRGKGRLFKTHERSIIPMPLNDVIRKRPGRLRRRGTLRLGTTVPTRKGGKRPQATDHFVMKDAQDLIPFYGEAPTSLPIHFPYKDFDRNVEGFHRVWCSGLCVCQGDGDVVINALPFTTKRDEEGRMHVYKAKGDRLVDSGVAVSSFDWNGYSFESGEIVTCPGSGNEPIYPHCEVCKPSIVIKVMIRDSRCARYGYYQISTRSVANYLHFRTVWNELTDYGRLDVPMNSVPFVISIAPAGTMYKDPKDKSWHVTEKWFLRLELEPKVVEKLEAGREHRLGLLLSGTDPYAIRAALPAEIQDQPFEVVPDPLAEDPTETPPLSPEERGEDPDVVIDGETGEITQVLLEDGPPEEPPPGLEAPTRPAVAWPDQIVKAVIEAKIASPRRNVEAMLALTTFIDPKTPVDVVLKWGKLYRAARATLEPKEAAAQADQKLKEDMDS